MKLLELKNIQKTYYDSELQTPALRGINFNIDEGEFIAVMGPSGSGKSTLLHILGCLDDASSGEYYFDGKNIKEYSKEEIAHIRNKKMGFIFQAFNLLPRTSVLENVKLPLAYSGIKESSWNKMAKDALESVGLTHRLNHEPSQLSGGEKQRVAIARALVNNPRIIFADEPTGNLDSKSGEIVMKTLQELNQKGHTIVLITHETYTAEYAERIIRLRDGLVENDTQVDHRRFIGKEEFIK